MRQKAEFVRLFISTVAAWAALNASAADCGRTIAADGPTSRTIVLAGGDAWLLLRQFLSEVERRGLDVSLRKSRIVLARNGQIETLELGLLESLPGRASESIWQRRLAGKRAEVNQQLLADARVSHWDIVCAGGDSSGSQPPRDAVIFLKSGVQYASRGDYANALREFKAAEKIAPGFNGLLLNLGATYLQLRDYVQASEYLRRAVAQNPRDASAHYNMACLQARLGQHSDAIASLSTAKTHGMKLTSSNKRDPDLASLRGRRDFENLFQ